MDFDILKKHNNISGAPKVFFVPVNTLMIDYYNAFIKNGFELYSLNFEGKWNFKEYVPEIMGKKFVEYCINIKPDWVFFVLDHPLIPVKYILEAKKAIPNAIFTNWTGDVREKPKPGVIEIGKIIDKTLIVGIGQIEMYKSHDIKGVEFLQTGVNVDVFYRFSEEKRKSFRDKFKHDIVFCANNSDSFPGSKIRLDVSSKLFKKYGDNFGLYGNGWHKYIKNSRGFLKYNDQVNVYNGAKIVISINNFNDVDMYFSARQLNAMASGTITVSYYIPGLEKYFEDGKDLVWFKTPKKCIELVEYYLKHEDEARKIGINGSKKVLEHHTKFARIKEMAKRLNFIK